MPKKKSSYKELKDIWYQKLEKSGFVDIEKNEDHLKQYSYLIFAPKRVMLQNGGWQAKATYYVMAGRFLEEYKFETRLDEIIWTYHSEGLSIRNISETLNKVRKKKMSRQSVWEVIRKHRDRMFQMYMQNKEYHE